MDVVQSVRRDLGQRGRRVGREELPFLVAAAVVVIVAAQWSEPGTSSDFVLLVVGGLALVALALFPRVPLELVGAAVLGPVSIAIGHGGHLEVAFFLVVTMTLYAAWHLGSTVRAVLIAVVCCVVITAIAVRRPDSYSWEPWTAAELFTLVLGRTLYRQRSLIMQLESAREVLADRAVAEERTRIARELHDLAGHTLAAMLLHITGARHVLRRDINDAEQALADAEAVGRSSMDQIRAVVAALRTTEHGTDPPLADGVGLHHLVEQYRRAGLSIEATITPDVAMLDGPVGIAVHRITREALANVARHAPTNRVELCVATNDKRVAVRIADHGRRAAAAGSDDNRFGLLGMTERARALGGTLVAEPSRDGWCVEVTLPFTSQNPSEVVE